MSKEKVLPLLNILHDVALHRITKTEKDLNSLIPGVEYVGKKVAAMADASSDAVLIREDINADPAAVYADVKLHIDLIERNKIAQQIAIARSDAQYAPLFDRFHMDNVAGPRMDALMARGQEIIDQVKELKRVMKIADSRRPHSGESELVMTCVRKIDQLHAEYDALGIEYNEWRERSFCMARTANRIVASANKLEKKHKVFQDQVRKAEMVLKSVTAIQKHRQQQKRK